MRLVITLVKYHQHGNLIMDINVPRNPVLDYMEQANLVARPYINGGWQMLHAHIE